MLCISFTLGSLFAHLRTLVRLFLLLLSLFFSFPLLLFPVSKVSIDRALGSSFSPELFDFIFLAFIITAGTGRMSLMVLRVGYEASRALDHCLFFLPLRIAVT